MSALWLYLRFESLQLDLLYQESADNTKTSATTASTPAALEQQAICLIDNQKLQVKQLNQAARLCGILPSHNISMACALCPQVQLLPYQPELELSQLQQVAALLYLHCADIALDPPASAWLRVDPMLQLYHGLAPLLLKLRQQLPQLHILLAAGFSAEAARLMACHQPFVLPFLSELALSEPPLSNLSLSTPLAIPATYAEPEKATTASPALALAGIEATVAGLHTKKTTQTSAVARPPLPLQQLATALQQNNTDQCLLACSTLPAGILEQLAALGIVRLNQLLALAPAELGRRFPKTLQLYLAELQGQQPASLVFYQPPEQFSEKLELLYHCEYVSQLQGPLTVLLKKLECYLRQRDQHCYQLDLRLELQDQAPLLLQIQSAQGEYQHQRWLSLFQLRLEQLKLPAPVQLLELGATQCCLKPAMALALFDRSQGALTPAQLQSLLLAKLGPNSLLQLCSKQEHRPLFANQCQSLQLLQPESATTQTPNKRPAKASARQKVQKKSLLSTPPHMATQPFTAMPTANKEPAKVLSASVLNSNDSSDPKRMNSTAHHDNTALLPHSTEADNNVSAHKIATTGLVRPALLLVKPQQLKGPITLQPGIERIVTGWWDGNRMERDYQIGRNEQGQWCWVFKDRSGWYLQGYFA